MLKASGYLFEFPQEFLKPALVVSWLSVWVLVGLFFYLNAFTRRRYFSIWSVAWLFYALWLTISLTLQDVRSTPFLLMLKHCCVGIAAVFMLWGASSFLRQATPERVFRLFLGFLLVWCYLGAYGNSDILWVQIAVFSTIGLASALIAYGFYDFRLRTQYKGATLLALGFGLWGGYLATYPFWQSSNQMIASGFLISAVLQLFIAVSMIILVLEEARTSNELVQQQLQRQSSEAEGLRSQVSSTQERFQSLFAQASEAIVLAAAEDLRILELNSAARRMLGFGAQDTGNQFLTSYLQVQPSGQTAPSTALEWYAALSSQHPVAVVRCDGTVVPVEVTAATVSIEGLAGYQLFFREVTERARLEQQLRQVEKMSALGQMISGIAHELNNPLAVIKGYLDLILLRHDLGKSTRADLEKVAHESNRAAKLVSNFLSFARELPPKREPIDLNQVVRRVLDLREIDMRILGVKTTVQLDPNLPPTEADPAQIEQVLVNLVTNSLHALAEWSGPRHLKITSSIQCANVQVRVEDSGPGVPADVLPRIFEPFFTTKPIGTGTGLGLSIAHSIMAEHNGRIYCESSCAAGAAFVIELPIVGSNREQPIDAENMGLAPVAEAPVLPPAWPTRAAQTGARVLILDDEQALGELLAELLLTLGHQPVTCCSGLQALELLEEQPFDLILSDFRMPQMNGREFYDQICQKHPHLASRVIFVTGDVVTEDTRDFLESVGTPHLSKPFGLSAATEAIEEVLQRAEVCAV